MTNYSLSVFPSMLLSLAMLFESFRGCFGTFSGTERPSLVKLPIEESVVKLLRSAKFASFFVLLDTFFSKFVY